ncbi:MAG: acetate--CoA ligase family protein [Gemmatimonadota bacterium]|nr:acetate--CoA ligase family protein [Gemmatimonadota bacterium]
MSAGEAVLDPILKPATVAVIGASRSRNTIGHQIVSNLILHGFTGAIFPVNPNAAAVNGIKAYPAIGAVPDRVDLAVIVVPKQFVLEVAEQCGQQGVRGLVVISAGFREVGGDGVERERGLVEICRRHGMRMVGPNCMGVLNTDPAISMNATFAPTMPPAGRAAFVSQSGALGLSVLDYAREYGIGISQFVSVGNKPDVSGNDLLLQWENDAAVDLVLMYAENFGNPRKFLEIAGRITRRKPIIVVKSGRSAVGARAASSHTGALAASDAAIDALLAQAGVLRAASIEELFDLAMAFGARPLVLPCSRRVAVLTNSGGPGILAADALEALGLDVAELSASTAARLAPLFPPEASIRNPLDMIASATPAGYRAALEGLLGDPRIDAVLAIFVPPLGVKQEDVAEAIVAATRAAGDEKPVLAVLMGRQGLPEGRQELHEAGIPAYIFPESAARALAAMVKYREWLERPVGDGAPLVVDRERATRILDAAKASGLRKLAETDALALLESYGVKTAPAQLARDADDAVKLAAALGPTVVMKIVSPDIVHKSDVGGVMAGIETADDARAAFATIVANATRAHPGARVDGVLVQRMITEGREMIAGVIRDPLFGPLVMFGLGGIYVEALRDVVFRVAPLSARESSDMVLGIRSARILQGMRGKPAADTAALADALRRVAQLATDFPEIAEIDVNPLLALPDGAVAADARVILG